MSLFIRSKILNSSWQNKNVNFHTKLLSENHGRICLIFYLNVLNVQTHLYFLREDIWVEGKSRDLFINILYQNQINLLNWGDVHQFSHVALSEKQMDLALKTCRVITFFNLEFGNYLSWVLTIKLHPTNCKVGLLAMCIRQVFSTFAHARDKCFTSSSIFSTWLELKGAATSSDQ